MTVQRRVELERKPEVEQEPLQTRLQLMEERVVWGQENKIVHRACLIKECPIDGGWSEFSKFTWQPCSATCGMGTQTGTRSRTCTNPEPAHGGNDCIGKSSETQTRDCQLIECTVNGGWTSFSDTTWNNDCSATCGTGTETGSRTRTCTNPSPAYGGNSCLGSGKQTVHRACLIKECPIDGGWSEFSKFTWQPCPATCRMGTQTGTRNRTCTNPEPAHGGKDCIGKSAETQTRDCQLIECPVDGQWSAYSEYVWETCSTTCGNGTQSGTKSRTCNNQEPAFDGQNCVGDSSETTVRECKLKECPIDGGWNDYSEITWNGDCSTTCDFGTETGYKSRFYTNPTPAYGGKQCDREPTSTEFNVIELPSQNVI